MTNTEQIRALIAAGERVEKWANELDRCKKDEPMSLSHRIAEDTYFSVDNSFSKIAANSRQAIAEMLEDNERMREEIKHLMRCKEFESNLQRQVIDVGAKYVTKEIGSTYTVTDAWEGIKQALKGTDDGKGDGE